MSGTPGVCAARTVRSGSAMVMITPMMKQDRAMIPTRLDLVSWMPTFSPMGIIAISAPSVKSPMPTISRNAPIKKSMSVPVGMGVMVMHSSITIAVTGRTAASDSRIFALSSCNRVPPFSGPYASLEHIGGIGAQGDGAPGERGTEKPLCGRQHLLDVGRKMEKFTADLPIVGGQIIPHVLGYSSVRTADFPALAKNTNVKKLQTHAKYSKTGKKSRAAARAAARLAGLASSGGPCRCWG